MLLTLDSAGLPQLVARLLVFAALALTCTVGYNYIRVLLLRRKLPPGPFPLPVIGNHYRIPYVQPWIMFEEWSRQYGKPMITIWLGIRPRHRPQRCVDRLGPAGEARGRVLVPPPVRGDGGADGLRDDEPGHVGIWGSVEAA